jgi:hypothetical protein
MQNNNRDITPEESLKLITSMIETTKHTISDTSHFYLLWGWAVIIGCLLQYYLKVIINYPHHYVAWLITIVAAVVHIFFMIRFGKKEVVRTFISEANDYLWTSLAMSFMVLMFVFAKFGWQYSFPIYIMLYGIGTYVSGRLLKFNPFIIGGICCFIIAAFTAYLKYDLQILITAFAILISYVIPGHLLRSYYRKTKTV